MAGQVAKRGTPHPLLFAKTPSLLHKLHLLHKIKILYKLFLYIFISFLHFNKDLAFTKIPPSPQPQFQKHHKVIISISSNYNFWIGIVSIIAEDQVCRQRSFRTRIAPINHSCEYFYSPRLVNFLVYLCLQFMYTCAFKIMLLAFKFNHQILFCTLFSDHD